ncbi:PGF-CTERM sorting domain-containing protein [Natrialbaceae archaeon A-gly3]
MLSRSQLTTVLVAFMLAVSMVAMASPAIAEDDDGITEEVYTLEDDEGLYLAFGLDLEDKSLEEYVAEAESHADNGDLEVVEYADVGDVELHLEGQATSVSIDGGEATAIQDSNQYNANSQVGEATAENHEVHSYNAQFEDVGDVTLLMGNGEDQSFDGYAIDGSDGISVSQEATAMVAQAQEVNQANVNEQTALAFAENNSEATAFQLSQQSNVNLQEGYASAMNVFAGDVADEKDKKDKKHDKHKKGAPGDGVDADQDAEANVFQNQDVNQFNVNEQSAVAIAVGEGSTATAVQMAEQTNLNEQVGTAEAANILMQQAGMNVATAGVDTDTDFLNEDGEKLTEPDDKKSDKDDKHDVTQTAEASVTQIQSVNQTNINEQSASIAVAANHSDATAVQLTFQQNLNAQIGSAEALNVMDADIVDDKKDKKDKKADQKYGDEHYFDGVTMTNTTSVVLDGDGVAGDSHIAFDYDGNGDQINAVEQWSNAEVEQSQEVDQVNFNQQQAALAIADDNSSATAVQLSIQENENVQFAHAESTSVVDADLIDDKDEKKDDEKKDEKKDVKDDEKKSDQSTTESGSEETTATGSSDDGGETETGSANDGDDGADDELPGFGVLVAIAALAVAGMARIVSQR